MDEYLYKDHISKGIKKMLPDGAEVENIPVCAEGGAHFVTVIMGGKEAAE